MNKARRHFLVGATGTTLAGMAGRTSAVARTAVRIGLTPVILDDHTLFLHRWRRWLESRLETSVEFVQRPRYRDITDLLLNRSLTAAWICGYPFVRHQSRLKLLVLPVYQGKPLYRSLVISGTPTHTPGSLENMRGQVFAYSDPDSNSGYLYPMYRLREMLVTQPDFFRRSFFSWGHRNTIDAVAAGLADGGAVDSYVWESIVRQNPHYAEQIRVVERSPEFGFPPLVTHKDLPDTIHAHLTETFLQMNTDPEGIELLQALSLDRFARGEATDFSSIAAMMAATDQLGVAGSR